MMKMHNDRIKLLDVTLRETPLLDYGENNIRKTLKCLENAKIDIIEVGFLGNEKEYTYKPGSTHFNNIEQANFLLDHKKNDTLYTVCMNGGSYDLSKLPRKNHDGIDAIRYVLIEGRIDEEINDLRTIQEKGYMLMVQHRNIMSYAESEIEYIIEKMNEIKPYAYSMVDTHGSMYPYDVKRLINVIVPKLDKDIFLGFHGHDNHKLATANAQTFLGVLHERENIFIDGSVMGAGVGAGNANTELLALYINRTLNGSYNLDALYDMIDDVIPSLKKKCTWGYSGVYLITGENNVLITHGMYLADHLREPRMTKINELLSNMPKEEKSNAQMDYWSDFKADFRHESVLHRAMRVIGRIKFLSPLKKIYLKLGFH